MRLRVFMYFPMVFCCDSRVHKGHSGIFKLGNYFLFEKSCLLVLFTRQRVGVVCGVWVAHIAPFGGQTCSSVMSLDVPLYPFPYEVTRGDGLMVDLLSMIVSFFPYFLSLLEKLHVVLLSLNLSILILMYFIAYFLPWFYYKFFKCFQFSS